MKYLKWIFVVIGLAVLVSSLCVLKYRKDWEAEFSPYSSRILREEIEYVPQPVSNTINEEQMPIGQTETSTYQYYITSVINNRKMYRIYSFDKQKKVTKLEYEVCNTEDGEMLVGVSSNGKKLILDYTTKIVLVDLLTQSSKEIYTGHRDSTSVCGQDIIYQDENGNIIIQNIKTGKEKRVDNISASQFVVYDDSIYYADKNNDNCVLIYDMNTGEIRTTEQHLEIGFFVDENGISVR